MFAVKESMAFSPRQPLNGQRVRRIPGLISVKIGTLNIGTMTGKEREVADLMERRKLEVLRIQETRWSGNKTWELGGGFKLFYSGADERGRNGVGIVLSSEHKENIVSVTRKNNRIMAIRMIIGETIMNIICVYAPQTCCEEEEKVEFWQDLDAL